MGSEREGSFRKSKLNPHRRILFFIQEAEIGFSGVGEAGRKWGKSRQANGVSVCVWAEP